MTHPRIEQFLFTRSEWLRGLKGISEEDGARHFGQMNCISWTVGHLAWHEQRTWLERQQGLIPFPHLNELFAYRAPMSTPSFKEMLAAWQKVARQSEPYLEGLTTQNLQAPVIIDGKERSFTIGSTLQRINYHYWYHIGEIQAIRQMLGHTNLPEFVGNIERQAPYRVE